MVGKFYVFQAFGVDLVFVPVDQGDKDEGWNDYGTKTEKPKEGRK